MPKLNKKQQKEVGNADSGDFTPIPADWYPLRLVEVKVSDNPGDSGYHYWRVQFAVEGEKYQNRRLWTNLSLSPAAAFKMREFFDAFEVDLDTDTDELVGSIVMGRVGETTIQSGERKGEPTNEIQRLKPLGDDDLDDDEEDEEPF